MNIIKKLVPLVWCTLIFLCCSIPNNSDESYPTPILEYSLDIIDSDGKEHMRLAPFWDMLEKIFWVKNDSLILVHKSYSLKIYDLHVNEIKEINLEGVIIDVNISPDRENAIFSCRSDNGSELYLLDFNDFNVVQVTNSPQIVETDVAFSHDGRSVICAAVQNLDNLQISSIQIVNLENRTQNAVLQGDDKNFKSAQFRHPHFGPQNKSIYFIRVYQNLNIKFFQSLYNIDVETPVPAIVDSIASTLSPISTSQIGEIIAYLSGYNIIVLDTEKNTRADLGWFSFPSLFRLSHDGMKLTVGHSGIEDGYIYSMNSDGSNKIKLARGNNPCFSMNGQKILFWGIHEKQ